MRFPHSFWKRGPAAYDLTQRAEMWVLNDLHALQKAYLSLRAASGYLGVGHKTLIQWVNDGLLKRHGKHQKFYVKELIEFLEILIVKRKKPPAKNLRLNVNDVIEFSILYRSKFIWDRKEKSLTPKEIAERIGCHPSTIIRAIYSRTYLGNRRTPCRWEIKRTHWQSAFPFTIQHPKKK